MDEPHFVEINNNLVSFETVDIQNSEPMLNADPFMSYNEFFETFLIKNTPCVFHSAITESWRSRQNWSYVSAPNFKLLRILFGNCEAPVADCNKKYHNAQKKKEMQISKYIDYWVDYRRKNYSLEMPLLYLKDWHCIKDHSNLSLYSVPKFFSSDWLNEYYMAHPELGDDYMFFYMGPKGSWTPLHSDVFTSYSWSANICGRKRWILIPPGQEICLRDINGNLVYDINSNELDDSSKYVHFNRESLKSFEIIQEVGEIIFVPSGWHHQVWNLEDTISINHNWINGCNIRFAWTSLQKELTDVMKEINDCRDMEDWEKHCQLLLKASFGMNYSSFYELLSFIAKRRLNALTNKLLLLNFKKWMYGTRHCLFDLQQIKIVLKYMIDDAKEKSITDIIWEYNEGLILLQTIDKELKSHGHRINPEFQLCCN